MNDGSTLELYGIIEILGNLTPIIPQILGRPCPSAPKKPRKLVSTIKLRKESDLNSNIDKTNRRLF